jgi:TRAP-type C4-dicarboxylate transport system permease large subunit
MPPITITGIRSASQADRLVETNRRREKVVASPMPRRDAIPAIIILQPIIGEVGAAGGVDPYHMGIVVVLTLAIGLITPPYGLCLLIASDLGKISVAAGMRALVPFYLISLGVLAVAVFLPDVILWIPREALPSLLLGATP